MEIIEAKLPNHLGYAHLLLSKSMQITSDIANRGWRKEIAELLETEGREIEAEREMISSKMFAY